MNKVKSKSITHGPMKMRRTDNPENVPRKTSQEKTFLTIADKKYSVPQEVITQLEVQLEPHRLEQDIKIEDEDIGLEEFFSDERTRYPQGAINLKGLRYREDLTQVEFAAKIGISQNNLSAMETGKRPIGKEIARRIEKAFKRLVLVESVSV